MTLQSMVFLLCLVNLVSGCAMGGDSSLVETLSAEEEAARPSVSSGYGQPAQATETPPAQAGGSWEQAPIDEKARAATMAHLRALALANRKGQGGGLSSSVAELKQIQATHAGTARSDITGGNPAQN